MIFNIALPVVALASSAVAFPTSLLGRALEPRTVSNAQNVAPLLFAATSDQSYWFINDVNVVSISQGAPLSGSSGPSTATCAFLPHACPPSDLR